MVDYDTSSALISATQRVESLRCTLASLLDPSVRWLINLSLTVKVYLPFLEGSMIECITSAMINKLRRF